MFEFAISQNKKLPPTRGLIASWLFSAVAHVAALIVLIENPGLLRTGNHVWIHLPALFVSPPEDTNWRVVTHVVNRGPMQMPSAATLKKNLYGWNDPVMPRKSPPIRVRLGDETEASKGDTTKPVPAM